MTSARTMSVPIGRIELTNFKILTVLDPIT